LILDRIERRLDKEDSLQCLPVLILDRIERLVMLVTIFFVLILMLILDRIESKYHFDR